jgi:secreted trypsin-like serine protease
MVGNNIVNVTAGEFSMIVSLKQANFNNNEVEKDHLCSGVLISKKDVLTTAHIFDNLPTIGFNIIIDSNDLRNGKKYFPYWWLTFDRWSKLYEIPSETEMNDIAVIRVNNIL